jgi:hypothetical protein
MIPSSPFCIRSRATKLLSIPPIEAAPPLTASEIRDSEEEPSPKISGEWSVQILLSAFGLADPSNYAGVLSRASTNWDPSDRSEPPMAPGQSVSLYFPHLEWPTHNGYYSGDFRGEYSELDIVALAPGSAKGPLWGHAWHFDVAVNVPDDYLGESSLLTFRGIDGIPKEATVVLIDELLRRTVDLRKESTYSCILRQKERVTDEEDCRFVLVVGTVEFGRSYEDELAGGPYATRLYQNEPNPLNPATVIRYSIGSPNIVTLKVFDAGGRLVKVLDQGSRLPGMYEISWNGTNEIGVRVSSGIYFCRLNAGQTNEVLKMLVIR